MPAEQLQRLQRSLESALTGFSGRLREDIVRRLGLLYAKAQAGLLPSSIQLSLVDVAGAVDAGNIGLAGKQVADLSATHWDLHKDWLVGLRRLLAAR